MNFISIIGLISAVATIVGLFIPENWRSKKIVFILFLVFSAIFSAIIVNQNLALERIKKVSHGASELSKRRGGFTDKGFIQASLAFMEQNKDLYPDSYERAKEIHENLKTSNFSSDEVSAAYELEGLLRGISILNSID